MTKVAIWLLAGLVGAWPAVGQAQTTVKYVHTDALGSVVAMTSTSGAVVETTREYEPYGQQLTPAIQDGPGYTGHVQDEATGLTYMQQRYYDPMLGVFLSVDPISAFSSPQASFHRYRYANGNPYTYIDPNGRKACGKDTTCQLDQGAYGGTIHVNASRSESRQVAQVRGIPRAPPLVPIDPSQSGEDQLRTNEAVEKEIARQIERIKKRMAGPDAEQYALIATHTRTITDVRGNLMDLRQGDIYKIGQTANPSQRYSQLELSRLGVRYEAQFYGTQRDVLIVEKMKLLNYYLEHGQLPPGNRIFR